TLSGLLPWLWGFGRREPGPAADDHGVPRGAGRRHRAVPGRPPSARDPHPRVRGGPHVGRREAVRLQRVGDGSERVRESRDQVVTPAPEQTSVANSRSHGTWTFQSSFDATSSRPFAAREARAVGSSRSPRTASRNSPGSSRISRCTPSSTGRPSQSFVVATTGRADARYVRILIRVPLPWARGAMHTAASRRTGPRSGTRPVATTFEGRSGASGGFDPTRRNRAWGIPGARVRETNSAASRFGT